MEKSNTKKSPAHSKSSNRKLVMTFHRIARLIGIGSGNKPGHALNIQIPMKETPNILISQNELVKIKAYLLTVEKQKAMALRLVNAHNCNR